MDNNLLVSLSENVCLIQINRFERKNALNNELYNMLSSALDHADIDNDVHVILLTGTNDVFSAGNDVEEFAANPNMDENAPVLTFLKKLSTFRKPIIAAVNGIAVGIGTTLLLHCDLVYAADTAQFSLPFVRLGLVPEGASTLLLPKRCGYLKSSELFFLGGMFNADEALDLNLVNKVIAREDLMSYAFTQAKRVASAPQSAILETKRLLRLSESENTSKQLTHEAKSFINLMKTPYTQAQFATFLKKNK